MSECEQVCKKESVCVFGQLDRGMEGNEAKRNQRQAKVILLKHRPHHRHAHLPFLVTRVAETAENMANRHNLHCTKKGKGRRMTVCASCGSGVVVVAGCVRAALAAVAWASVLLFPQYDTSLDLHLGDTCSSFIKA